MILTVPRWAPEPETHCYRVGGELKIPARRLELDDGEVVEVPERAFVVESFSLCGRLGDPCVECGDVAEVLCDFPLGELNRTCDKPLCPRCAPTIGLDKNFCREHAAAGAGPNMLLFRRPEVPPDPVTDLRSRKERRPRLPKAPPIEQRWRVLQGSDGAALTAWTTEMEARRFAKRFAKRVGGRVETWDQFVSAFRARWPLKGKPRKR